MIWMETGSQIRNQEVLITNQHQQLMTDYQKIASLRSQ